jgi:hypothetical protein
MGASGQSAIIQPTWAGRSFVLKVHRLLLGVRGAGLSTQGTGNGKGKVIVYALELGVISEGPSKGLRYFSDLGLDSESGYTSTRPPLPGPPPVNGHA